MTGIPGWTRVGKRIVREFVFPDFPSAIRFVTRV
ncbi:MAG: Pterin 4 alpha carbinolamine dehydratase, partial [Verrucomicrobiota bacterium]